MFACFCLLFLFFIERRFYGESTPFGKKSHKTAEILGYLNSQQALADCAILIRSLKQNLSSEASPVFLALADWFRLKYPHIAIGALASSAPILQFDNIVPLTSFYDAISQDFKVLPHNLKSSFKNETQNIYNSVLCAGCLSLQRRFYGESTPFGKKSHKTAEILGYLNSQQALADCAILIRSLKQNLSSEASPVFLALADWFRLKYPHIAIGALASSAPILQFDNIVPLTSFYDAISQDFKVLIEKNFTSWYVPDRIVGSRRAVGIVESSIGCAIGIAWSSVRQDANISSSRVFIGSLDRLSFYRVVGLTGRIRWLYRMRG
ncbi:hypothetical protein DY000_02013782 [Brassica cretica]|uniref:Anaphase-promoting complex subunit 1 n=1 Tax=Brassica cretica TaxID=69181 RepID=A0ABQ7D1U3_BRACR|nr:hypothetical protein DY000_02013782 [Brassica cretica]